MRKINKVVVSAVVFAFVLVSMVAAQENLEVKDVKQPTSKGMQTGFSVFIKDATLDVVTKKWGQYMKNEKAGDIFKSKNDKVKYEIKGGEYLTERAVLTEISNKYISTIATILSVNGGVQLTAFFELDSVFISKQTLGSTYTDTRNYVRSFAVASYKDVVNLELAREDKKLDELQDKLASMKEKKTLLEKNILRSEANISELESQLRANLSDQERTSQSLKLLNDSISAMKVNTPEYTVYNNRLKEESKTQKRLLNDNGSIHKKIENNKKSIIEDQEAIKKNQVDQEYQLKQIESQIAVISNVKTKLGNIR
jgi:hypothetical protein